MDDDGMEIGEEQRWQGPQRRILGKLLKLSLGAPFHWRAEVGSS